mgnify:CR=1 FL=1
MELRRASMNLRATFRPSRSAQHQFVLGSALHYSWRPTTVDHLLKMSAHFWDLPALVAIPSVRSICLGDPPLISQQQASSFCQGELVLEQAVPVANAPACYRGERTSWISRRSQPQEKSRLQLLLDRGLRRRSGLRARHGQRRSAHLSGRISPVASY